MILTWQGKENFTIKTKSKTVRIGQEVSLGELKVQGPGEYESGGVQLEYFDGVIEIFSEKMTIAWIKKAKVFSDDELEKLGDVNVLLVGVGGGEFTETKTAQEAINQIEPSVVIPMYSQNLESFTKEEGSSSENLDQYKFTLTDLPTEERKIVLLTSNQTA